MLKKKKAAPKKKPASKKKPAKKLLAKPAPKKTPKTADLDLSDFPPESITSNSVGLCLACALHLLTRLMGLSAERAQAEVRRYSPTLEELSAASPTRPYFPLGLDAPSAIPVHQDACPYCGAPSKWHAPLRITKIEGGKSTDAPRRALLKKIGNSSNFSVIEEKATQRDALYGWLAKIGTSLDLDSPSWLLSAARHWLARRLPKEDWSAIFNQVKFVRRSRRLEEGFEIQAPALYLAPALFDEILFIQYLLSRSHKAGGRTFEGRLTLQDLVVRLRRGGYLKTAGVTAINPADALEQLVEILGGEDRVKFHYIVDRRDFLSRLSELKSARVPLPRPTSS